MTSSHAVSLERRASLLQAAAEVAKNLTTILDLDELLPKTVDVICNTYGFYYAGIFLLDPSGQWAVLRAGFGEAGQKMIAAGHKLEVGGHSMIGASIAWREARIVLHVGEEAVHFKNPYLPETRSEMALPLIVGDRVLGAVTVQSVEEAAFSEDDITSLQAMADHLAIAINNAYLMQELRASQESVLRLKTYEALATATTQAIHWIGNKALPIASTLDRVRQDVSSENFDAESLTEDLDLIEESVQAILEVKETLVGQAIEHQLRPSMLADVVQAAAFHTGLDDEIFTLNASPEAPLAMTDSSQLVRVLGYLLENALEAGAEHISANIAPALDRRHVAISIADDGEGIESENLDKIWTAFFTTKGVKHTGLGLAASLAVLSRMGGRITVDSHPGQGATFTIVLPAAPDDEATDLSSAPDNIFFVDEEDDAWALFAANVLRLAGKEVVVQGTPAGAAAADLILVDEALTTMPLEQVLNELREAGVIQKAIVVTAALDTDRATQHMRAGVRDVALKPYTYVSLSSFLSFEMEAAA